MVESEDYEIVMDRHYETLRNFVTMVSKDYTRLLILDADGGLGKTHTVIQTLKEECEDDDRWIHHKGFTTPLELYKTLYTSRHDDAILFLDDIAGIARSSKALDMLKAATDTQGEENVVEYHTSQEIDHPFIREATIPNEFTFRGNIIMSLNGTPDTQSFEALRDRGTYYELSFTYDEMMEIIHALATKPDFSDCTVETQKAVADWIEETTNSAYTVTIRTFDELCSMRTFADETGADWEKMALDVFNINKAKHCIIKLRHTEMPVEEQITQFNEQTGYGRTKYYDLLDEIRVERGL